MERTYRIPISTTSHCGLSWAHNWDQLTFTNAYTHWESRLIRSATSMNIQTSNYFNFKFQPLETTYETRNADQGFVQRGLQLESYPRKLHSAVSTRLLLFRQSLSSLFFQSLDLEHPREVKANFSLGILLSGIFLCASNLLLVLLENSKSCRISQNDCQIRKLETSWSNDTRTSLKARIFDFSHPALTMTENMTYST